MVHVAESIRQLGGIASTAELIARGHQPDWIRMAVDYGRIIRIRRGWFAAVDTPTAAIEARRVGGRLACVSALVFHGVSIEDDPALHVAVAGNASRLRPPFEARAIVVHWQRGATAGGRLAVAVGDAWAQRARCRALRRESGVDSL